MKNIAIALILLLIFIFIIIYYYCNKQPIEKIDNSNKILILSTNEFKNAIDIIQWMIDNKIISNQYDIILYDINKTNALEQMTKYINLGYKCILGTQNSIELLSCVDLLEKNKDKVLYFDLYSTSPLQNNLPNGMDSLPINIIRTALIDDELCYELFDRFLINNNFYNLLKLGNHNKLAEPLELSNFKNICYIYQPSIYTENFLQELTNANSKMQRPLNITSEIVTDSFTQNIKNLLTKNPISNPNFKTSDKTLFIINSSTTNKMIEMFDKQEYSDNYFLFGDAFFDVNLSTSIMFKYAFVLVGNFSQIGYKYSKFVDPKQNVSPLTLGLIDVIMYFSQIYFNNLDLSISELISLLKRTELIKYSNTYNRDYWFIKQMYAFSMLNDIDNVNKFDYSMVFTNVTYNPTNTGGAYENTYTDIYTGLIYIDRLKWNKTVDYFTNDAVYLPNSYSIYNRKYLFVCKKNNYDKAPNIIANTGIWRVFPLQQISNELIYQFDDIIKFDVEYDTPNGKTIIPYKFRYNSHSFMFDNTKLENYVNFYNPNDLINGSNYWQYIYENIQWYQSWILYFRDQRCKIVSLDGLYVNFYQCISENTKNNVPFNNANWKLIGKTKIEN